jgi:hypothetical protein
MVFIKIPLASLENCHAWEILFHALGLLLTRSDFKIDYVALTCYPVPMKHELYVLSLMGLTLISLMGCQSPQPIENAEIEPVKPPSTYKVEAKDSNEEVKTKMQYTLKKLGQQSWMVKSNLVTLIEAGRSEELEKLTEDLNIDINERYPSKNTEVGYQTLICEVVNSGLQTFLENSDLKEKTAVVIEHFIALQNLGADTKDLCENGLPIEDQAKAFMENNLKVLKKDQKAAVRNVFVKIRHILRR